MEKNKQTSPIFSAPVDLEIEVKSMNIPDPDFHNFDKYKMGSMGSNHALVKIMKFLITNIH